LAEKQLTRKRSSLEERQTMDVTLFLSRAQFAFTIGFHYLFPQLTMGLALFLVILKALFLKTGEARYNAAVHFWSKIFAVTFLVGVVTGIPMEFQFGTNWARFSASTGGVIAQLLAMEGAFAFFLESAVLGVFLFGERAFGQKVHFTAAILLWLGTWSSGAFITAANSWMQHPVGYALDAHGHFHLTNYWDILFNPWFFVQYFHTMSGAVVTASFVVAGIGAFYLLNGKPVAYGRLFLTVGVIIGLIASLIQLYPSGDLAGQQVAAHQPVKLAAMEGLFQTQTGAGVVILGQPDPSQGTLDNPLIVPGLLSFLTYRRWTAVVQGLDGFPRDIWPDSISLLYYCYHIMVGLGTLFILIMALAAFLLWRRQLFRARWMLWILLLATPFPFIANTAGWFTAELGRQPWVVYGLMRTSQGETAPLSAGNVLFTLLGFLGLYLLLGLLYAIIILTDVFRASTLAETSESAEEEASR